MADAKAKSLHDEYPQAIPLTGGEGEMYKWEKAGQTIRGKFIRIREGNMGGDILTLDTANGLLTCSAPRTLSDALSDVKPGTEVVIRYLGERQPKKAGGRPYKAFEAVAL
jgi:hypothetical protein